MAKLKTGLIGAGVFGGYHAGKIAASDHTQFVGVFDPDMQRGQALAAQNDVQYFNSNADLLQAVDAVLIACPASYHAEMVRAAIDAQRHIMVEKPLALTGAKADALAAAASDQGLILQVGHQERFVLAAMGLFDIPEMPIAIDAVRAGPPSPDGRAGDVSVIWDLMTHDFDMVAKLMGMPLSVEAEGRQAHTEHVDDAQVTLTYPDGKTTLWASRCHSQRERRMQLTYPSGQITLDFLTRELENSTPYTVQSDISAILPDPLAAADEAFFEACLGLRTNAVPGHEAAQAVHLAEQAELSVLHTIGA